MIFQDPFGSLNPRRTVSETLRQTIRIHKLASDKKVENELIAQTLEEEAAETLPGVQPVAVAVEFAVVDTILCNISRNRSHFRVLPQMSLQSSPISVQDQIVSTQRMKQGPIVKSLDSIVGTVQNAPACHMLKIAAVIEVLVVEESDRLSP